jgi:hypothetical protein
MFSPLNLFSSLLFSLIGMAYIVYGKKEQDFLFLGIGFALAIYPYFVDNVWIMIALGLVLAAAPFFIRRWVD